MNNPAGEFDTRPLVADDLQRVIEIDSQYTGRRREGFYRTRLQAAQAEPANYVYLGCEEEGVLQGFLLARLQEGEYGTRDRYASMDAVSVDPAMTARGMGRSLLHALDDILRHKGIDTIYSQADWHNLPMLKFFGGCGFSLAARHILERDATNLPEFEYADELIEESAQLGDANDYSDAEGDQRGTLARDRILCRSMRKSDLEAIVKIDLRATGRDHRAYYEQKIAEVLGVSGIRVSLVAEQDDHVVGFVMARVDFGEFDRIEPVAVLDSIAVDPGYAHHLVGTSLLSQLLANLWSLQIEHVRSETDAEHLDVMQFLQRNGFSTSQRLAFTRQVA
jgi:N-acetylglutamate synthase-like GNAT family acetyltransferase